MIDEVIKAFLLNIRKDTIMNNGEISNEDLLSFFGERIGSDLLDENKLICFSLVKNKRYLMDMTSLCTIKEKFPQGIDAL